MFERLKAEYDAEVAGIFLYNYINLLYDCICFITGLRKKHLQLMWLFIPAKAVENKPIKVTLPDGNQIDGVAWKTTPYEVAASIR